MKEKRNVYKYYEVNRHRYYKTPKQLFFSSYYRELSSNAKLLYSILLDRMELSRKNGWINEKGEIYIKFRREAAMELMGLSSKGTITRAFNQLKEKSLIYEERPGQGRANLIYIGKIDYIKGEIVETPGRYENHTSDSMKSVHQEVRKSYCNDTDFNDTDFKEEEERPHTPGQGNQPFTEKTIQLFIEVLQRPPRQYEVDQLQALELDSDTLQKAIKATGNHEGESFAYLLAVLNDWKENKEPGERLTAEKLHDPEFLESEGWN